MVDEGLLQRMQRTIPGKSFDGRNLRAVLHDSKRQAGIDSPAVDQHCAGSALTVIAAFLGAGQREMVAKGIQECGPGHELDRTSDAIDDKVNWNAVGNLICGIGHVVSPVMEAEPGQAF
jgi:hypothetical protein